MADAIDQLIASWGQPAAKDPVDALIDSWKINPRYGVGVDGKPFLKPSEVGATPPTLTAADYLKPGLDFVNKGLVGPGDDLTPAEMGTSGPLIRAAVGASQGVKKFASSMTAPANLALLAGGGALVKSFPLVSKALAGGFGALMTKQAAETAGDLAGTPKNQRTAQKVAEDLATIALTGGTAGLTAYESALAKHPTVAKASEKTSPQDIVPQPETPPATPAAAPVQPETPNATIPVGKPETLPVGQTPGDSGEVGARVPGPEAPAQAQGAPETPQAAPDVPPEVAPKAKPLPSDRIAEASADEMRAMAKQMGRDLGSQEPEGMWIKIGDKEFLFINKDLSPSRKAEVKAHELKHRDVQAAIEAKDSRFQAAQQIVEHVLANPDADPNLHNLIKALGEGYKPEDIAKELLADGWLDLDRAKGDLADLKAGKHANQEGLIVRRMMEKKAEDRAKNVGEGSSQPRASNPSQPHLPPSPETGNFRASIKTPQEISSEAAPKAKPSYPGGRPRDGDRVAADKAAQEQRVQEAADVAAKQQPGLPGTEGERSFESAANPNSGLPAGVPDRGPDFPQHLMEASRQLGALARSKVTLRPGVEGRYIQTLAGDRIEARDIRNQNTVAHEIGHALDATVFPGANMADSQASLAARAGTGTGKELVKELKPVSELMRGPMTGTKSHVAYRNRATELIADYFSLYAHDSDRARAMAPKFTAGFEKALAAHPDAKAVVDGLIAGNVSPESPTRATPGTTTTPVKLAGKVAPRPDVVTPREREAAHAAEGLVKGAVRTLEAETQSSRVLADKWRKQVPKENDRYDVGAFVEGIGNLQIKGDTIDAVKARMTPEKLALASEYRYRTELARQKINEFLKDSEDGEYLRFVEDYLGHFYADDPKQLRAATSKFSKDSPHAKARKLPTLKEAVDMGLTPITQDPATTYELTNKINWRVATNRKFVSEMKDLKGANGDPMVVPAKDAPPGWHITDNPLIQRVYARKAGDATMLWKGGAGIHPDVWRAARQILENPTRGDLAKAYDAVNGVTRANAFAFSFFHDLNLRAATVGAQMSAINPMRGLVRLMEVNPLTGEREAFKSTRGLGKDILQSEEAVRDAALHGLRFSYTESEAYQQEARTFMDKIAAKTRTVPYAGKATAALRDLQQKRFEGLWKNTHDAYKIAAYNDLVGKALQSAPTGVDPTEAKVKIASMLNDAFGGQEWQSKFWLSPQMRTAAHRFFLASDWTLSTLRSVPGLSDAATSANRPAPSRNYEGTSGNVSRGKFWTAEVAGLAMATIAAQHAIYSAFGKAEKKDKPWVWDNEYGNRYTVDVTPIMRSLPWANPNDPTRHYINLGKRAAEVTRWFSHPEQNIEAKASRPVAEMFKQLTGESGGGFKEPWAQDHETFIESLPARAKSIGTEFFPFVFSGSQFAMSVPMRNGMTKYKAQQAYESVFELVGDPMGPAKSVLRGQPLPEGELPKMVEQITDAAQKNGVPAEEVRNQALSNVRGHHYGLYFKALKDQDVKELKKQTEILTKLGTTSRGLEQSMSRREKMLPK